MAEEFIDYITKTSTPKALDIKDISDATKQDATLQAVSEAITLGNWFKPSTRPGIDREIYAAMEKVKDQLALSSTHNIILRGTRIVIPSVLQQRVIDLAHEGHQGIVKLLREKGLVPCNGQIG